MTNTTGVEVVANSMVARMVEAAVDNRSTEAARAQMVRAIVRQARNWNDTEFEAVDEFITNTMEVAAIVAGE